MSYAIGIDLGTTNATVSVFRKGVVQTLPIEGRSSTPSVVSFQENGSLLIGNSAKSRILIDPDNTVCSSKRSMGNRSKVYMVGGKRLTPVNIASYILKKLVQGAEEALGSKVYDVVITVPAYFTEDQKEDTRKAGEEAGLNVLRLIPEPTAAAIAYGLDKSKDQTIMVYDLGGGTFDVSILAIKGNNFTVKAVGGDSLLGGDDFDQKILEWAASKFKAQTGIDVLKKTDLEGNRARQQLKEVAEAAKIALAETETAFLNLPSFMGHSLELELHLKEYNELIYPLLERTIKSIESVLRDAEMTTIDIDRVILVGGSTKNKIVREVITKHIKEPYIADKVDEVVSNGAAIVASNLFLPDESSFPIEIIDVTGHSLGVDMLDNKNEVIFYAIIPRQSSFPCRHGLLGSTVGPYQNQVVMRVFRGESTNVEENTYLGELCLEIVSPQKEQVPIGAIFELDADGIIHFTAVQLPISRSLAPIQNHALENNGALELKLVDQLIASGDANVKTARIKV